MAVLDPALDRRDVHADLENVGHRLVSMRVRKGNAPLRILKGTTNLTAGN